MLRGLADYSMSGRRQAATVAILFGLIPMLNVLSGAVVALVTLRRGVAEGLLVLLWAALPAGLQWLVGDSSALFMIVAALLSAALLRASESWSKTLALLVFLAWLTQLSLPLQPTYVAQVSEVIEQMMDEGQTVQLAAEGEVAMATSEEVVTLLLRFYGLYHFVIFMLSLCIARHWQALLYNPGGFRQEFHALRLDPRLAGFLLALLLAGELGVSPLDTWVPLFCLAPWVNGIALVHFVVAQRKLGLNWLILAWLLAVFLAPAAIILGFADSFANLRRRLAPEQK